MNNKLVLYPNAKINIGLKIISKRGDAYHDIHSFIYPIPYFDILEVIESELSNPSYSGIHFDTENDFIQKLYSFLREKNWIPTLTWHLHKQIPIGSGLGGGSSDLACFAQYLKRYKLVGQHWSEVEQYVLQLSTDAFYFLYNKPALVKGKGDVVEIISLDLSGKYLLLLFPDISVNTSTAYHNLELSSKKRHGFIPNDNNIFEWKRELTNDFEDDFSKVYSLFNAMKEKLYNAGALYVSLTGSGSVIYALFDKKLNKISFLPRNKWIRL